MTRPNDDRTVYRCPISPENSGATLIIKKTKHPVSVVDTSREAFTVRAPTRVAKLLSQDAEATLLFSGDIWRVSKDAHFHNADETSSLTLNRIEELTKVKEPTSWWSVFVSRKHGNSDPVMLMFLMCAFLFACVALPGVGDNLGTAPRIRSGIHLILDTFRDLIW